eukprot:Blabericola_migrator_1__11601@NODE_696_length_6829_cov_299_117421_g505_i0_p2_GENE_NODE_696_length_6829_cov_299_117421_g505_i0NODE_696_length_6829_cov_299_117421_g505_i0_p2_ORF_typecomplete_len300_score33_60_NODE_696_length_6829_cov_299_117421_g505_i02171116
MARLAARPLVVKICDLTREPTTSTLSSDGSSMDAVATSNEGEALGSSPTRVTATTPPSQSTHVPLDDVTSRGSVELSQPTALPMTKSGKKVAQRISPPCNVCPVPRRSVCRLVNRLSDQTSGAVTVPFIHETLHPDLCYGLPASLLRHRIGPRHRRSLIAVPLNPLDEEVRQAKYLQRNSLCTSTIYSASRSAGVCGPVLGPLLDALVRRPSHEDKHRSHPNNTNNGFDPFDCPPPPPPRLPLVLPQSYRERLLLSGFTIDGPFASSSSTTVASNDSGGGTDDRPSLQGVPVPTFQRAL